MVLVSWSKDFAIGFFSLFEGAALILSQKKLQKIVRWLLVWTALIFTVGLGVGLPLIARAVPVCAEFSLELLGVSLATWHGRALLLTLEIFYWPAQLAGLLCLLFIFSKLLAAPFYAKLADQALGHYGLPRTGTSSGAVAATVKAVVFLGLSIVLIILAFLPGLGLIASFGFLLWAAFDTVDVSFDALGLRAGDRWRFVRKRFPAFCGLAAAIGLVFLVPGLNFLLFPASVVGASRFFRSTK